MSDLISKTINYLSSRIKETKEEQEKQALIAALKTLLDVYFGEQKPLQSRPHYPTCPPSPLEKYKIWCDDNTTSCDVTNKE